MKYRRRILEAALARVQLDVTGGKKGSRGGQHLVTVTLIYPRPAIAERVAVKTVSLKGGTADLRNSGWSERILFKEDVQGPFGISVDVTEELSDKEAGRLLEMMASGFLKLAGDEAADIVAGPWAGGLIRLPLQYLSKAVSSEDAARSIGSGSVDLCADEKWQPGETKKVEVPLIARREISSLRRVRRGGEMETRQQRLLKAGQVNGCVELALRTYD